jgi:hypothetical protein
LQERSLAFLQESAREKRLCKRSGTTRKQPKQKTIRITTGFQVELASLNLLPTGRGIVEMAFTRGWTYYFPASFKWVSIPYFKSVVFHVDIGTEDPIQKEKYFHNCCRSLVVK